MNKSINLAPWRKRVIRAGAITLMVLTVISIGSEALYADQRRPFYVIAHRSNSVADVEAALAAGANAVEIDLKYDRDGARYCVNHDLTWFCDTEDLVAFLDGVLPLARRYPHWAMIVFDSKDSVDGAKGLALIQTIRRHLTDHVPLASVISVPRLEMRSLFDRLGANRTRLRANEVLAIDYENNPNETQAFFNSQGISNQGYANGVFTYCFWCVFGWNARILDSVTEAVSLREARRGIKFVYVWTLGRRQTMAEYIDLGVDGILVNQNLIDRILAELRQRPETVVLAPRNSQPFTR